MECGFLYLALFLIWGDDAGREGKLLFTRKEVFPLSPRPSLPFKKSGGTFLFTFTYPSREQNLVFLSLLQMFMLKNTSDAVFIHYKHLTL